MSLKDESFVNKVKVLFVCNPENVRPSNFCEMLKNVSEVTLVTMIFFFLKDFEVCAKFREVQSKPG